METKMGRLTNKNILITGGTRGIGLASAQEFRADVSKLSDLDSLYSKIKADFGHLDVVFANAGYSEFGPFEVVEEETFDNLVAVNLKGVFFTIQKAVPLLP